ncbi:hypothetical protein [Dactylosporangium cerinum]
MSLWPGLLGAVVLVATVLGLSWTTDVRRRLTARLVADLAITGEAGDHQRWVNPARAFVLAGYALVAGEGSGYLYWFDLNDLELSPWVTVAPLLFAVLASFNSPRAEPSRG